MALDGLINTHQHVLCIVMQKLSLSLYSSGREGG